MNVIRGTFATRLFRRTLKGGHVTYNDAAPPSPWLTRSLFHFAVVLITQSVYWSVGPPDSHTLNDTPVCQEINPAKQVFSRLLLDCPSRTRFSRHFTNHSSSEIGYHLFEVARLTETTTSQVKGWSSNEKASVSHYWKQYSLHTSSKYCIFVRLSFLVLEYEIRCTF